MRAIVAASNRSAAAFQEQVPCLVSMMIASSLSAALAASPKPTITGRVADVATAL